MLACLLSLLPHHCCRKPTRLPFFVSGPEFLGDRARNQRGQARHFFQLLIARTGCSRVASLPKRVLGSLLLLWDSLCYKGL
jgi:hypothetical protein